MAPASAEGPQSPTSRRELLSNDGRVLRPRALAAPSGHARVAFDAAPAGGVDAELERGLAARVVAGERTHERVAEFRVTEVAPLAGAARLVWAAAQARAARPERVRIFGVLNVTPDSFSDGGRWLDPAAAVDRGLEMVSQGADVIDIGGESTRPGAGAIDAEEECRRVLPCLRELARRAPVPISVDTMKSAVAERALDLGARIVNDVSAGRFDPRMLEVVARGRAGLVLMHMQGTPADMQQAPSYADVVSEVLEFLRERAGAALEAGCALEGLWIDPGIGFGKRLEHNLALFARLGELRSLGLPVLVGPSRKSFIAALRGPESARGASAAPERLGGTAAAVASCVREGAAALRVHDVATMVEAVQVAKAIRDAVD